MKKILLLCLLFVGCSFEPYRVEVKQYSGGQEINSYTVLVDEYDDLDIFDSCIRIKINSGEYIWIGGDYQIKQLHFSELPEVKQ